MRLRRNLIRSRYASMKTPIVLYTHDGITGTLTLIDVKARSLCGLRTATFACVDYATALRPALRQLTKSANVLLVGVFEQNEAINAVRRLTQDLSYWREPCLRTICETHYKARSPTGTLVP